MKIYACFFHETDRCQEHETAHALLRFVLRQEYGIEDFSLGKNSHGKPFLSSHPDIYINLSHCCGLAVCGAGCAPLGIDCEPVGKMRSGAARRVCAPIETVQLQNSDNQDLLFTRIWTLKESFVKAVGRGISYPMKNAVFSLEDNHILTNVTGAGFCQYIIDGRFVISACSSEKTPDFSIEFLTNTAFYDHCM
ncbi:MAG: 4'-phosphopantetheinyl transferase superfamily protein [Oscillospiraceae bacterium]|nr:4'-phosphopantetheinyl transferase superfamily protein [Oscillospiraceae bacterium]